MRKRKETLIRIIIIAVLFLGIGYAYITTNLSINGTADVDSSSWNVYWNNVQVTSGSVSGSQVITAPTISNQTTVSFHIRLKEPGEYYEFTVDAKNTGTIDAMIDTITTNINNSPTPPEYLKYKVTYGNGNPIENNHLLSVNSTQTYKVRIEYRTDINPTSLPSTAQSLSVTFTTDYIQATSAAVPALDYVYVNTYAHSFTKGADISTSNATFYRDPRELINETGYPFFLRITLNNNINENMEVGFILDNNIYYLEYGVPYETAVTQLDSYFDGYNCYTSYNMHICNASVVYGEVVEGGTVYAGNSRYWCTIYNEGNTGLCWDD